MITAIDTEGEVYWSLLQTNTNDETFGMYLKFLTAKLDEDRPNWRHDSILQIDGARYHKSAATMNLLDELQVPYIISAPYSYDCSCIELWFSRLKYSDINVEKKPVTKSKFDCLNLILQNFLGIRWTS